MSTCVLPSLCTGCCAYNVNSSSGYGYSRCNQKQSPQQPWALQTTLPSCYTPCSPLHTTPYLTSCDFNLLPPNKLYNPPPTGVPHMILCSLRILAWVPLPIPAPSCNPSDTLLFALYLSIPSWVSPHLAGVLQPLTFSLTTCGSWCVFQWVLRMPSTTPLIGRTSPAIYPFDQTSHTTSSVGPMFYDVFLAFDCPPDTFPGLLNLQHLQLVIRRPAHSCASSNHSSDILRYGSYISSPTDHPLRAFTLLKFCYFWASGLRGVFAICNIYSITSLCLHNIMIIL